MTTDVIALALCEIDPIADRHFAPDMVRATALVTSGALAAAAGMAHLPGLEDRA